MLCLCTHAGVGWSSHYSSLKPNRFYVKFDDDIMFIKDSAIDDMLHEKLKKRFWIISANVINHSGQPPFCSSLKVHGVNGTERVSLPLPAPTLLLLNAAWCRRHILHPC